MTRLSKTPMFEAFTLKSQEVEEKEDKLRLSVRELEDSDRMNFHKALSDRMKDPDTYAVLNFFFITGIHHFYLENHAQGSINLIGFVLGLLLLLGGLDGPWEAGISLIVFIIVIELPALFRSQIIVKNYNNLLSSHILTDMRSTSQEISINHESKVIDQKD